MTIKHVMKATDVDLDKLQFPVYVSAKIDGVRGHIQDCTLYLRSNKVCRNKHTLEKYSGCPELNMLDFEMVAGNPTAKNVLQTTTSAVMSYEGTPDVKLYVHDVLIEGMSFAERYQWLLDWFDANPSIQQEVRIIEQILCNSLEEVLQYEEKVLSMGYEGICFKRPDSLYKHGRSTAKEGHFLRLKRFVDDEAVIVGVVEMMENTNTLETNELGYAKRSSAKDGMIPTGKLGAYIVNHPKWGEFSVGATANSSHEELLTLWQNRDTLIGKMLKFKYFPKCMKDKPRLPISLGIRDESDL